MIYAADISSSLEVTLCGNPAPLVAQNPPSRTYRDANNVPSIKEFLMNKFFVAFSVLALVSSFGVGCTTACVDDTGHYAASHRCIG